MSIMVLGKRTQALLLHPSSSTWRRSVVWGSSSSAFSSFGNNSRHHVVKPVVSASSRLFVVQRRQYHYRAAIVGSGPSACYTAKYLLSSLEKKSSANNSISIDMLERLPTPYGLVRYGVAPDHPEVKNVENDFAALMEKPEMNFLGNVHVGKDISIETLRDLYDIVVLAYGCESDRKLNIPGEQENLTGILSAREFVAWYNGHPEFEHIGEALLPTTQKNNKLEVVVIGQGNVALDCARILAKGSQGLIETDIASRALPFLEKGRLSKVTVLGRRGHIQGAFTIKELRELTKLQGEGHDVKFVIEEQELNDGTTPSSLEELAGPGGRPKTRIDKLLREAAAKTRQENLKDDVMPTTTELHLRFLLNPIEFQSSESDPTSLGAVICQKTKLDGEPGKQSAIGTDEMERIPAQLALISIGYKGVALPGLEEWYDNQKGIIKNIHGKVDNRTSSQGGLYVSGWLKRGPSGIIGTNIPDAKDTVASILKDLDTSTKRSQTCLQSLLVEQGVQVVTWKDFQEKIHALETSIEYKRHENQPREKITTMKELLATAAAATK